MNGPFRDTVDRGLYPFYNFDGPSPVILTEFDPQSPVALRHLPRGTPTREHIHTVVRTLNGGDYGMEDDEVVDAESITQDEFDFAAPRVREREEERRRADEEFWRNEAAHDQESR